MSSENDAEKQLEAAMSQLPGVPRKRRSPTSARFKSRKVEQRQLQKPQETYEVMARRRKVDSLRLRDFSYPEIARELSIPEEVVRADVTFLRKRSGDAIDEFQQRARNGIIVDRFSELRAELWKNYNDAVDDDGNPIVALRLKCLDQLRVLEKDEVSMLQEAGLLVKAADRVEHAVVHALPWTPEVRKFAAEAMLRSRLTPMLPEPIGEDVIDVDVQEPIKQEG